MIFAWAGGGRGVLPGWIRGWCLGWCGLGRCISGVGGVGGSRRSGGVVWGMPLWIICGSIVGLLILAFLFTPP